MITAILDKMSNTEAEVRRAALDALRQLNDTNAVPGLQSAVDATRDLHEKVAILDTIDYIKMPSATENVPVELATNQAFFDSSRRTNRVAVTNNVLYNPAFAKGRHSQLGMKEKPSSPANAPAAQPR